MNKIIGSTLIAAGTAIGAGMLAFPLVAAGPGFLPSVLIFVFTWAVMLAAGLLTLEVNLAFQAPQNSYPTMAQATLGKPGYWVTYISVLLLFYMLIAAYITGGGSLFEAMCTLVAGKAPPSWLNALIFTFILGGVVAFGTRAVDLLNRTIFSFKIVLLGLVFVFFLPQVNVTALFSQIEPQYGWGALPVAVTAFGFHTVLPSLAPYLGKDARALKKVLFFASIIPLIIYIVWIAALLGSLPYDGEAGFKSLAQGDGSLSSLMLAVNHHYATPWLNGVINGFANFAMITSFLGVSLSLFDCLHDKKDKNPHRARTALLTFLPPLCFVIFYPEGFVTLLSVASIFVAIILIIIPALMAYRRRQMPSLPSSYQMPGGNIAIATVLLLGIGFIVVEILRQLQWLPIWS